MQMAQNNYAQKIKDLIQQLDEEKLKNKMLEEKIKTLNFYQINKRKK